MQAWGVRGAKAQIAAALEHAGVGQISHAVHVLRGVELVADLVLIRLQVLRQPGGTSIRVDGIVGVELLDLSDQRCS